MIKKIVASTLISLTFFTGCQNINLIFDRGAMQRLDRLIELDRDFEKGLKRYYTKEESLEISKYEKGRQNYNK